MSCTCSSTPCCCTTPPSRCACPPSPTPPWSREYRTDFSQTLDLDGGAVSLTQAETYLSATAQDDVIAITIADGSYNGQKKQIYNKAATTNTAEWTLTGTFKGFTSLTFNDVGLSALLNWDEAGWHMIAGTAIQNL